MVELDQFESMLKILQDPKLRAIGAFIVGLSTVAGIIFTIFDGFINSNETITKSEIEEIYHKKLKELEKERINIKNKSEKLVLDAEIGQTREVTRDPKILHDKTLAVLEKIAELSSEIEDKDRKIISDIIAAIKSGQIEKAEELVEATIRKYQAKSATVQPPDTTVLVGEPPVEPTWNLDSVRAADALEILPMQPSGDVDWGQNCVAVLDTGYTQHSALGPWIAQSSPTVIADQGINFKESGKPPLDPMNYEGFSGHGIRIMSVLSGLVEGEFKGVAPRLPIVPYRITNSVVIASNKAQNVLAAAIRHVVDNDTCSIILIGLGHAVLSPFRNSLGSAIDYAYENGVIVIAPGGQSAGIVLYPAKFARTIGVGGLSRNGSIWPDFSETDTAADLQRQFLDVWAPADEIYRANSEFKDGIVVEAPYSTGQGTSYSAVHVAAAAAMWFTFHGDAITRKYAEPWQRIEAFRRLLVDTSKEIDGSASIKYQRLDMFDLLTRNLPAPTSLAKEVSRAEDQWS